MKHDLDIYFCQIHPISAFSFDINEYYMWFKLMSAQTFGMQQTLIFKVIVHKYVFARSNTSNLHFNTPTYTLKTQNKSLSLIDGPHI